MLRMRIIPVERGRRLDGSFVVQTFDSNVDGYSNGNNLAGDLRHVGLVAAIHRLLSITGLI